MPGFFPVQCCTRRVLRQHYTEFFLCKVVSSLSDNIAWSFGLCMLSQESIKTKLHKIFSYGNLSGASSTTWYRVLTCVMLSQNIKTNCTGFFLIQCCLEPLRQYCIGFCPVQCCPKGIKITLHRFCPDANLSGASRTTLNRVLTCAMLS